MAWWLWVLLWALLLIGSAGVFFLLGLSLWRKARVLAHELGAAADRLGQVSDGLQKLAEQSSEPAVFAPASQLRQERIQRRRGAQKSQQSVR